MKTCIRLLLAALLIAPALTGCLMTVEDPSASQRTDPAPEEDPGGGIDGGVAGCPTAVAEHATAMQAGRWSVTRIDHLLNACGVVVDPTHLPIEYDCVLNIWWDQQSCLEEKENRCGADLPEDLAACFGIE